MPDLPLAPTSRTLRPDDGLTLGYRELGDPAAPPVLLLHGWPTSSYLWRNVMPALAREHHALALDLPGFGASDKPPDATYDFPLFERAIDGFLAAKGLDRVALAVHDVGGPVGVHWALARPGRVSALAILNTLLYPELSDEVRNTVAGLLTPGRREELTSPESLAGFARFGVADPARLDPAVAAAMAAPFAGADARLALAKAGSDLDYEEYCRIAPRLPELTMPVRIVYGEQDRALPDIARTVARLRRDIPHAEVTALPDCGHFLQEEAPERIGALLAAFFAAAARPAPAIA